MRAIHWAGRHYGEHPLCALCGTYACEPCQYDEHDRCLEGDCGCECRDAEP